MNILIIPKDAAQQNIFERQTAGGKSLAKFLGGFSFPAFDRFVEVSEDAARAFRGRKTVEGVRYAWDWPAGSREMFYAVMTAPLDKTGYVLRADGVLVSSIRSFVYDGRVQLFRCIDDVTAAVALLEREVADGLKFRFARVDDMQSHVMRMKAAVVVPVPVADDELGLGTIDLYSLRKRGVEILE